MPSKIYSHENSYSKKDLASIIHRIRLKLIIKTIRQYKKNRNLRWADFGCSNGFIIDEVKKKSGVNFSKIVGYDSSKELINLAKEKTIPNTKFKLLDMNINNTPSSNYDLVTCFETLEHVGNPVKAFENLFQHLNPGGILFVTMPNETGMIGFIKFVGRYFLRRNPYGEFFKKNSKIKYGIYLLMKKPIAGFRLKNQLSYGPHLGFEYRSLEETINKNYVKTNYLKLINKRFTVFYSNVVFVYKKMV